jgi:hypothetical protein
MGAPNEAGSITRVVETDMREFERLVDEAIHIYPGDPKFRRSGDAHPQPGDIALCGHVKVKPYGGGKWRNARVTCSGCATLKAMQQ